MRRILAALITVSLLGGSAAACGNDKDSSDNTYRSSNGDTPPLYSERLVIINGMTYCIYVQHEEDDSVCNGLVGIPHAVPANLEYDDHHENSFNSMLVAYLYFHYLHSSKLVRLQNTVIHRNKAYDRTLRRNPDYVKFYSNQYGFQPGRGGPKPTQPGGGYSPPKQQAPAKVKPPTAPKPAAPKNPVPKPAPPKPPKR